MMMLLSIKFVVAAFVMFTVCGNVFPEWVENLGMWYYISENNILIDYKSARNQCSNLGGQLATIVNDNQLNFIGKQLRNTQRWIGYSTLDNPSSLCSDERNFSWAGDDYCVIQPILQLAHENTCSAAVMYTDTGTDGTRELIKTASCNDIYGFICQWQCKTLYLESVITHLNGIYEMIGYHNMRKSYAFFSNVNRILSYNPNQWSIIDRHTSEERIYQIEEDYVPYYIQHWLMKDRSENVFVDFVCIECNTYTVKIEGPNININEVLQKVPNIVPIYQNQKGYVLNLYGGQSANWCFKAQNQYIFCTNYTIHPNVVHAIQFRLPIRSVFANVTILCNFESFTKVTSSTSTTQHVNPTTFTQSPHSHMSTQSATNKMKESYTPGMILLSSKADETIVTTANENITNPIDLLYSTQAVTYRYETKSTTEQLTVNTELASSMDQPNLAMYIGVPTGILVLLIISVIAVVVCYRRRQSSATSLTTNIRNVNDAHVVTAFNIYAEQNERVNVYADITPHSSSHSSMSNLVSRANLPVPEPVSPTLCVVDKSVVPNANTDVPIYATVSHDRTQNSHIPLECLYSKVNKNNKRPENVLDISDARMHPKTSTAIRNGHTNDSSEEEFSDNEIYNKYEKPNLEQSNCPNNKDASVVKMETNQLGTVILPTTVLDNLVLYDDDEDDEIEMHDNDVYGQHI